MRRTSTRLHMVPKSRAVEKHSFFRRYWIWFFLDALLLIGIVVALILFNNKSKLETRAILEIKREIKEAQELTDKLEVERAWMLSTGKLREKAEQFGMREAHKGQIRSR